MFGDVMLHWMLDMSGAITFWWIVNRASSPMYPQGSFGRVVAERPWTAQMLFALLIAWLTVRMVG